MPTAKKYLLVQTGTSGLWSGYPRPGLETIAGSAQNKNPFIFSAKLYLFGSIHFVSINTIVWKTTAVTMHGNEAVNNYLSCRRMVWLSLTKQVTNPKHNYWLLPFAKSLKNTCKNIILHDQKNQENLDTLLLNIMFIKLWCNFLPV